MSKLYDLYIAAIGSLDEYESNAPEHKIAVKIKQLETENDKLKEPMPDEIRCPKEIKHIKQLEAAGRIGFRTIKARTENIKKLNERIKELKAENNVLAEQNLAMNNTTVKQYHWIEQLKEVIKKCNQYTKIIKIGLTKNDAKYLEAEQIEKVAQKILEKK